MPGNPIKENDLSDQDEYHQPIPMAPFPEQRNFFFFLRRHSSHRLLNRFQPNNIITAPIINPKRIPNRTLLISIPSTRPNTIENSKAASPLRTLGLDIIQICNGFGRNSLLAIYSSYSGYRIKSDDNSFRNVKVLLN